MLLHQRWSLHGTTCTICGIRSEEHTSELQSHLNLVCRLLLEKKNEEVLKLGVQIIQTSAAKYMVRRRDTASQVSMTVLRNHATCMAAIDMFHFAASSCHLCYR